MGRAARDIDHVMLISRDLAHASRESGVPHERSRQTVRVLPDSAHGALLEFTV